MLSASLPHFMLDAFLDFSTGLARPIAEIERLRSIVMRVHAILDRQRACSQRKRDSRSFQML